MTCAIEAYEPLTVTTAARQAVRNDRIQFFHITSLRSDTSRTRLTIHTIDSCFINASHFQSGAKVDQETSGYTALYWAAHNGHTATLQALLRAGSSRSAKDTHDRTARDLAAWAKKYEVIGLLQ